MKSDDLTDVRMQIAQLEKQLGKLYERKAALLESELRISRDKARSMANGSVAILQSDDDDDEDLEFGFDVPATPRGRRKARAIPGKTKRGKKRLRMSTEDVERRLIETVANGGSSGLSQKEISEQSGVNYQTTAKKLKEMTNRFEKRGRLKDARYFLKA